MQHIETVTVGSGGAASITFMAVGDIPSDYTDLLVVLSLRTDANPFLGMDINGSSANFTNRYLDGNGAAAGSDSRTDTFLGYINGSSTTANTFANTAIYFPNYRSSANKSFSLDGVSENNGTTAYQNIFAGLWSQTAAITSLTFYEWAGGNLVEHSSASLYGITAGSDGITAVS